MKRILKSLTCFSLILSFICCGGIVSNAAISSQAKNAILIDQTSGNVMYSKNAYEKAYPASTTKLMTAIVYYEKFKDRLNGSVTVGEELNELPVGSSVMNIEKGEIVTREQLLHGLMLASGNDAAIVMAYDHSGSMAGFVQEMNNKAKQFGMNSTHFANSHGFHNSEHYTTAADFAILTREYMKYEELRKIGNTSEYAMAATNKKEAYTMYNSNRLISSKDEYKSYVYEKATGLKTGFTNAAKNCLVGTATNGNTGLIWVGFGYETSEERFTEAKSVFEYAFNNFSPINVYEHIKDTDLYVDVTSFNIPEYEYGNVDTMVQINAKEQVSIDNAVVQNLENNYVYAKFNPLLSVQYPIKDGDYIGNIEYYADNNLIYTAKAYATKYVEDRSTPSLINTALINKRNGYGSQSFLEQAVSLGMEMKDKIKAGSAQSNENNSGETTEATTTITTEATSKSKASTSTAKTTTKASTSSAKSSSSSSSKKSNTSNTSSSKSR